MVWMQNVICRGSQIFATLLLSLGLKVDIMVTFHTYAMAVLYEYDVEKKKKYRNIFITCEVDKLRQRGVEQAHPIRLSFALIPKFIGIMDLLYPR